jgi:8-oxo-dGTP pyrophosphatase MutT (NUDIX family)
LENTTRNAHHAGTVFGSLVAVSYQLVIVGPFEYASRVAAAIEAKACIRVVAIVSRMADAEGWLLARPHQRVAVILEPSSFAEPISIGASFLRFRRGADGSLEPRDIRAQAGSKSLRVIARRIAEALPPRAHYDLEGQLSGTGLSSRDREVLKLLCAGLSNVQIAREIHLSPGTVKNYVTRLFRRLSVRTRSEAILRGVEFGLVGNAPVRRVAVAAWINDIAGRVLLHREKDGSWGLPCGRVEPGETLKAALQREVWEETGLEIAVGQLIGVYSDPHDQRHTDKSGVHEYVTVYARGRIAGSQSIPTGDARFFNIEDLQSLKLARMSPHWLEDALRDRRHPVWR